MSWYLPEKRTAFLHIPRTGGTWTGTSLLLSGVPLEGWRIVGRHYRPKKHTLPMHYDPEFLEKADRWFTLVRHPFKYYVSVWRFVHRCVFRDPDRMKTIAFDEETRSVASIDEAVNNWKPDFDEWLDWMLENEPGWMTRWMERYVGPPGGEYVHFVGRTETIEEDVGRMMELIGYGEEWRNALPRIRSIRRARNAVNDFLAPRIELTEDQKKRLVRGERVFIRRFFEGKNAEKRIYRDFETGEPT